MQLDAVHTVRTKLNFIFPPISPEAFNRFLPRVSHSMRRRIAHRHDEGIASSDWALLRYCVKTEKSWHSQGQDHGFKSDPPFFSGSLFFRLFDRSYLENYSSVCVPILTTVLLLIRTIRWNAYAVCEIFSWTVLCKTVGFHIFSGLFRYAGRLVQ